MVVRQTAANAYGIAVLVAFVMVTAGCGASTSEPSERQQAAPTPRGSAAVFYERGSLWLLDVQTGRERRIEVGVGDLAALAWSRDGRQLAFAKNGKDTFAIATLRVGGGGQPRVLYERPGAAADLDWSPDGTTIAVASSRRPCFGRGSELAVALIDVRTKRTTSRRAVPPLASEGDWFAMLDDVRWRPDGGRLLYSVVGGGRPDECSGRWNAGQRSAWTIAPGTGDPARAVVRRYGRGDTAWSADGTRLAVSNCQSGGEVCSVGTISGDGGSVSTLTSLEPSAGDLEWTRTDTILAAAYDGVYAVNPTNGTTTTVMDSAFGFPSVVGTSRDGLVVAVVDDQLHVITPVQQFTVGEPNVRAAAVYLN